MPSASRDELWDVQLDGRAEWALAHAGDPRLAARLPLALARRRGRARVATRLRLGGASLRAGLPVAGGDDGHPHLVVELLVEHRSEDDVRVGVRGLRDRL